MSQLSDSYLSEIEKTEIQRFNENKVLKEAIRKVMLEPLYLQGTLVKEGSVQGLNDPTRNFVLTPVFNMLLTKREMWDTERIGQWTLTCAQAIQMIEQGFGNLEKYAVIKSNGGDKAQVSAV